MASASIKSKTMSLERLTRTLGPLLSEHCPALLGCATTLAKFAVFLLFLVNVRSWPFAWHIRVFRPVTGIYIQLALLRLRLLFKSRAARLREIDQWRDSLCPVGADPFNYQVKYNSWASIDDCDFNGHLSNSSYAKTMDSARFKAATAFFPMFFRAGGWMALAATHYHFIREIPMLASYEVRLSVGTWDHKWFYVIAKFVTKPSRKGKTPPKNAAEQPSPPESSPENNGTLFHASVRTPADDISMASTPLFTSETPTDTEAGPSPNTDTAQALKAAAASLASGAEPDGAVLHTISISQCCFKIGRITVPPALVFAVNGFSTPPPPASSPSVASVATGYSHADPPPHWQAAKTLRSKPLGGSWRKLKELLEGGWKDVPEGERWWETALGGVTEEKRRERLEVVRALGMGIAGARQL
ncbi:putative thioesterase-like superfamily protein [Lyophyllum shimeji]|uniref:Thioesterase-like superfamily protein n=1 Tax=Lyophyllum shimeji TaxID=47721 RepID=A0A9P3Q2Y9_LYOSH|nr:putative thioesterase-like superfamily protein [Lyophyllum shimeji]